MNDADEVVQETASEAITTQPEVRKMNPIPLALDQFLRGLEDLRDAATVAGPAVGDWQMEAWKKQCEIIDKYVQTAPDDPIEAVDSNPHGASTLLKASKELERLRHSKAVIMLMRSLFIGIFSEYDVFIGNLLKSTYESKPDLFKGLKREITLSELLEFPSVEAVKQDILNEEIDSFRRKSYVEQFAEMETKFDVKTLRNFPEWATFVEFGQRRNLLTHNGGLCSEQYLTVCDKVGFCFAERPEPGQDLMPSGKYFSEALFVVAKVAFMLTYTLWRKLFPDNFEEIDKSMNDTLYELLSAEKWRSAAEFGKFGLSEQMCKKTSDIYKRIRVINTAIGLKQRKKKDEVAQLLKSMDWSACVRDFKLAIHILNDDYKAAADMMRSIGENGEMVGQLSYHSWPLFQDARDNPEFQKAYEEIYGVPFIEEAAKEAQAKVHDESLDNPSLSKDGPVSHSSEQVEEIVLNLPDTPKRKGAKNISLAVDANVPLREEQVQTVADQLKTEKRSRAPAKRDKCNLPPKRDGVIKAAPARRRVKEE